MWPMLFQLLKRHDVQAVLVAVGGIIIFLAGGAHTWFQLRTHARNDPEFQIEEEEGQTE